MGKGGRRVQMVPKALRAGESRVEEVDNVLGKDCPKNNKEETTPSNQQPSP